MKRFLFWVVFLTIATLILLPSLVEADVDKGWDWEKVPNPSPPPDTIEKTEITYCFDTFPPHDDDVPADDPWRTAVNEAAKEWNETNTGWKFKKVENPTCECDCQVIIHLSDKLQFCIYNPCDDKHYITQPAVGETDPYKDRDADKRTKKVHITFDKDNTKVWCLTHKKMYDLSKLGYEVKPYGTEGDTLDRRTVAKHELGHALRLKDIKKQNNEQDVMWHNTQGAYAQHPKTLSQHDKDQAKDSVKSENRGTAKNSSTITPSGGTLKYTDALVEPGGIKAKVIVPPGTLTEPTILMMTILYQALPFPYNVTRGECEMFTRIVSGIEIETIGPVPTNMEVWIYYGDLPIGPEFPAGIYFDLPVIDEIGLRPFRYISESSSWQRIMTSFLDTDNNGVQFFTSTLGIFGLSGPTLLREISVGGFQFPIDKLSMLAPYIISTSIVVATAVVATAIYVKRVKRRKEKQ